MFNKNKLLLAFLLVGVLIISGCSTPAVDNSEEIEQLQNQLQEKDNEILSLNDEVDDLNQQILALQQQLEDLDQDDEVIESIGPTPGDSLLTTAIEAIQLIADMNMDDLGAYVHPTKGVRFTPYDYVNIQDDIVIQAGQFQSLVNSPTVLLWGYYDGIGDPITLTFDDYYDSFIYDVDFENPHMIGNNVKIGMGNSLNNVDTAYPNGQFIEFHFTGFDPQYEGMDWRSLKLVFEQYNNAWHLVGIIHGQWTI